MSTHIPTGLGVDESGGPVIDPTANVIATLDAAVRRLDDLRKADGRRLDDLAALRADHDKDLRVAEAARIDAIRAVDVNAVQVANAAAEARAATLAAAVVASAEALRLQVATTAAASDGKLTAALEPIQKDIADLRRVQYEGVGQKTQVVEARAGLSMTTSIVVAVIAFVSIFVTIASVIGVYLATH